MARTTLLAPRAITETALTEREAKPNTVQAKARAVASFTALTGKSLPADPDALRDYLLAAVNAGHALATITTRMALLTSWHDDYMDQRGHLNENLRF